MQYYSLFLLGFLFLVFVLPTSAAITYIVIKRIEGKQKQEKVKFYEDGEIVPNEYVFIDGKKHHLVYSEDGQKVPGPELGIQVVRQPKLDDWKRPNVGSSSVDGEIDTEELERLEEMDEGYVLATLDELLEDSQ